MSKLEFVFAMTSSLAAFPLILFELRTVSL